MSPAEGPESAGLTRADRYFMPTSHPQADAGAVAISITVADDRGEQTFGTGLHRPTEAQRAAATKVLVERAMKWLDR